VDFEEDQKTKKDKNRKGLSLSLLLLLSLSLLLLLLLSAKENAHPRFNKEAHTKKRESASIAFKSKNNKKKNKKDRKYTHKRWQNQTKQQH
jgi:hypothetical protein